MKRIKKSLALLLALMMCLSLLAVGGLAAEPEQGDIVILYTNDVHNVTASTTGVPDLTAYAKLAAYRGEMEELVGAGNVTLVDAGDSIQGKAIGTLTKGGYPVEIMNEVGYDVVTLGNHEFDFGMERMLELMDMQEAKVVSANFIDLEKEEAVFDAYTIIEYGDVKVAYVGITTPESFTKSTPTYFQNEDGKYIYGFCEGDDGQELYDVVQNAVDAAIADGADYVVAIGHLGVDAVSEPWRSTDVIANTTGIDVFIDGHSHTVKEGDLVENKDGDDVLLTQTGSELKNIGRIVITADGTISSTLIPTAEYENVDEEVLAYLDAVTALFKEELETVIGKTSVDLTTLDPATGLRMIRNRETNLGALCADAYRYVLGADIGFVNGGGIRADIKAGDITYGQVISVHPYNNVGCVVEATGQQIIDALEMASRAAPGENGGFLQVSGIEFTIDIYTKSTVVTDDKGMFVEVTGERRVKDVKVGGEDIDLEATYSLASHNYMLLEGGDGINMFMKNEILVQPVILDNQVLITYINEFLDGVVGEEYTDPYGQGRIKVQFIDTPSDQWWFDAFIWAYENGIIEATGGSTWEPSTKVDVATAIEAMYNLEGRPEVEGENFDDVDEADWFYESALWAKSVELSIGDDDGKFDGLRNITRAEQAAIFVRYLEIVKGYELESEDISDFADADEIPVWFAEEGVLEKMVASGIMQGRGNNMLVPNETAVRYELARLVLNVVEFMDSAEDVGQAA